MIYLLFDSKLCSPFQDSSYFELLDVFEEPLLPFWIPLLFFEDAHDARLLNESAVDAEPASDLDVRLDAEVLHSRPVDDGHVSSSADPRLQERYDSGSSSSVVI
jgi:hypothetical protein